MTSYFKEVASYIVILTWKSGDFSPTTSEWLGFLVGSTPTCPTLEYIDDDTGQVQTTCRT